MDPTHITVPVTFTRLYSDELIYKELAPLGINREQMRSFFRSLGVPVLHLGSVTLIDPITFSIALKAVLSLGQPDFNGPNNKKRPQSTLNLDAIPDGELENFIAQLLLSVKLTESTLGMDARHAAREAVQRLREMGLRGLIDLRRQEMRAQASLIAKQEGVLE